MVGVIKILEHHYPKPTLLFLKLFLAMRQSSLK